LEWLLKLPFSPGKIPAPANRAFGAYTRSEWQLQRSVNKVRVVGRIVLALWIWTWGALTPNTQAPGQTLGSAVNYIGVSVLVDASCTGV
jgi:hypothetical protein